MDRTEEWRFFTEQLQESALKEFHSTREHEADLLYQQGMKDCVWLLKNLGVLAHRA